LGGGEPLPLPPPGLPSDIAAAAAAAAAATACPPPDPCVIEDVEIKRDSTEDVYAKAKDLAGKARQAAR